VPIVRPDICFARGTFNSHPYVMGAMCEFLHRLDSPEIQALYRDLDATLEHVGPSG
jgi:glutamate-1-semialdehyde 2,1-aminomutase